MSVLLMSKWDLVSSHTAARVTAEEGGDFGVIFVGAGYNRPLEMGPEGCIRTPMV